MRTRKIWPLSLLIAGFFLTTSAYALPPWKPKFKEMFVDNGPKSLQDAFADKVIGSCKVCHVNGEEKTVRNPFGASLDKLIEGNAGERLKAAAKNGDDAKAVMQAKIDKEFLAALDKVLKLPSQSGDGTYGERIKAGKLPFVPAPPNTLTEQEKANGWQLLFNGTDFTGWKLPQQEHNWNVIDGVIDYEAKGGNLVTEESFTNYQLRIDWRFKRTVGPHYTAKMVDGQGNAVLDRDGKQVSKRFPNADSGIFLRGTGKSQVNIWCWPCGSGQFWSFQGHEDPVVRAAAWPDKKADKSVGEWNTFEITVIGEEVTVVLNGVTVTPTTNFPGLGTEGPITLQHHGGYNEKKKAWSGASSLIQFRNIRLKPLD